MDCIFCKIVRRELPCRRIYEDEHALVFMDAAGDVDGHMLAVPKKHIESILDCDGDTLDQLMRAIQRVAEHCTDACGYGGVNLLNASGACAGQSVPHLHIHILPRRSGDGIDAWPKLPGAKADAEEVFNKLRMG